MSKVLKAAKVAGPGQASASAGSAWEMVYKVVRRIPAGRVMTYGQVSDYLGRRLSAVAIGWAMAACPEDVPWQRVVNATGGCSTENSGKLPPGFQKKLLRREGVRFGADGRLSLERYRWTPRR